MKCTNCGNELGDVETRAAFMAMKVMGDEYVESYWKCEKCDHYTMRLYHDSFSGPDTTSRGDEIVATIRQCPDPGDERCACAAHRKISGGW